MNMSSRKVLVKVRYTTRYTTGITYLYPPILDCSAETGSFLVCVIRFQSWRVSIKMYVLLGDR